MCVLANPRPMTATFSPLARGRGTWDGQLELGLETTTTDKCQDFKISDEISRPRFRPDLHRHGVTVHPRARSAQSARSARPLTAGHMSTCQEHCRTIQLPKTYVTRQGALLLFAQSDVAVELTDRQRVSLKKMPVQQNNEKCARSFGSLFELAQSVLTYGAELGNKEAEKMSEVAKEDKIFMKFLHSNEHDDLLDVKSQPGGDVAEYLHELKSRASSARRDGGATTGLLNKRPSSATSWTEVPLSSRQPLLSADVSILTAQTNKTNTPAHRVKSAPSGRRSSTTRSRPSRHSIDGSSACPRYLMSLHRRRVASSASHAYDSWPSQPTVTPVSSRPASAQSSIHSDPEPCTEPTEFVENADLVNDTQSLQDHSTEGRPILNNSELHRRYSPKRLPHLVLSTDDINEAEMTLEPVISEEDITMANVTNPYQSYSIEEETFHIADTYDQQDLTCETTHEEVMMGDEEEADQDETIDAKLQHDNVLDDQIDVCPDNLQLDEESANSDSGVVPYSGVTAVEVISHHEPSLHSSRESEQGSVHSSQHMEEEDAADEIVHAISVVNTSLDVMPNERTSLDVTSNESAESVEDMTTTGRWRSSSSSSRKTAGSKNWNSFTQLAKEAEVGERSKSGEEITKQESAQDDTEATSAISPEYDYGISGFNGIEAEDTKLKQKISVKLNVHGTPRIELTRQQTVEDRLKGTVLPSSTEVMRNNAPEQYPKMEYCKPLEITSFKPADLKTETSDTVQITQSEPTKPNESIEVEPVAIFDIPKDKPKDDVLEQMRKQLTVTFSDGSQPKESDNTIAPKVRAKVKKKEKIKRKDDARQKQQSMEKDAKALERERRLGEAEQLESKIKDKEIETRRLADEAEKKRLEMAKQLAQATAEAKEAQLLEEAALEAAAEVRRLAKEEREERRRQDMERKKVAAAKRREEEKKILDAARKMERDMLEGIGGGTDDLLKQKEEEDELRKMEAEECEAEREKEEERFAKKVAQEEEDMIFRIEEEAEEEALAHLVQSREQAEQLKYKLHRETQELEEAEKKLRDALLEDERKLEAEVEEMQRKELERQRMHELEEAEVSRRMQLDIERHLHMMLMRRNDNLERRSHLSSIQQNQGFTRPWVFSYGLKWPRDTYECLMVDEKKKKNGTEKKKTKKTRKS